MSKLKKYRLELTADNKLRCRMESFAGTARLASGESAEGEAVVADNYMTIPFRALSAIMLPDRPIDFSKEGVVAAAAPMLNGLTMYADHYTFINNWLGKTANGRLSEAADGRPEGIDFDAVIYCGEDLLAADADQRKLIIGLREGIVKSCSVGVEFAWEKSHPEMKNGMFWDLLGEEVDGEIVRAVVTEITAINEVSLVWEGADPNAKRLDLGKLPENLQDKYSSMINALGGGDTTELTAALEELETHRSEKAEMVAEISEQKEELKDLQDQLGKAKADLAATGLIITGIKSEIIGRIQGTMRATGNEQLLTSEFQTFLETQTIEELNKLLKSYQDKADLALPLTCASCGSTNISRRSSVQAHQNTTNQNQIDRKINENQYRIKK